jgi:hypothetical protein
MKRLLDLVPKKKVRRLLNGQIVEKQLVTLGDAAL